MSLIADPDHLIHSLRLAYLKRIDDHYGPRVITFPSVTNANRPTTSTAIGQGDATTASISTSSSNTSFFASSSTAAQREDASGRSGALYSHYNPFSADAYVAVAGLTDASRHPELETIYSPVPTVGEAGPFGEFNHRRGSAHKQSGNYKANDDGLDTTQSSTGLSYTQTIYGPGRSGALGMRVNGRRASKRVSIGGASAKATAIADKHKDAASADYDSAEASAGAEAKQSDAGARHPQPLDSTEAADRSHPPASIAAGETQGTVMGKRVNFADPPPVHSRSSLDVDRSSDVNRSSEGRSVSPHPATSTAGRSDSVYAESSTESNTALSSLGSAGSLQDGSLGLTTINAAITGGLHSPHSSASQSMDPTLTARSSPVLSRPAVPPLGNAPGLPAPPKMIISTTRDSDDNSDADTPAHILGPSKGRQHRRPSHSNGARHAAQSDYFSSIRVSRSQLESRHASRPKASMLSSMLQKQDSSPENPFAALYAGIAGRSATAPSMTVEIYFPWAEGGQPPSANPPSSGAVSVHAKTKCMKLNIRKDATMEEVIGYGLYCFVEERWKPELNAPGSSRPESEREARLTTIGWTLMIVEDGEVDDDFPAIDQSLLLGKFGGDEFAICEATPNQIKQHRDAYAGIARRTLVRPPAATKTAIKGEAGGESVAVGSGMDANHSMLGGGAKGGATAISANPALASRLGVPGAGAQVPAGSVMNVQGTPIFASGALSRSALGSSSQSIFLRVLVTPNPEVRYKTTLQVPSDMYLADVLEMICRKRHLSNVDDWALIVPDKSIVVPLDRTVESLQGNHDLALVRRSSLGALGGTGALSSSSTNPNASIFKRYSANSDASALGGQPKYTKALDIAAAYKSYTVYRKSPMFGGRHNERSLTLDGDWLHIMPTDMKTFGKAASFHVSSVVACKLSSKLANAFKLVVWRESPRDTKRYDFEADSTRIAAEIVREINLLRSQNS